MIAGSRAVPDARSAGRRRVPRSRSDVLVPVSGGLTLTIGYDKPLYILPFDHRGSFQTKMFGWKGALTEAQTAEIAATKQVIYDAFKAALADGVPQEKAGILVDEQFGASILRDAASHGYSTSCPAEKS